MLADASLESSWVVANCRMNRERQLLGANSYEKALRFDFDAFVAERPHTRWLDLCCGSGRALIAAASRYGDRVTCHGVDLVDAFDPLPAAETAVTFEAASLHTWKSDTRYDLITCVHGLHYIGDKLGLLARIRRWLADEGRFIGHLDPANVTCAPYARFAPVLGKRFRKLGIEYDAAHRLLGFGAGAPFDFGCIYVGADDNVGPNFTGQDAVRSHYIRT